MKSEVEIVDSAASENLDSWMVEPAALRTAELNLDMSALGIDVGENID
ncbi:MAG: hypothetical protein OSB12_03055 [Planctomycetota bacterium]|jgi:hypothetical protein|nr:hypothetical protein [Planctomycetota bacterium]